MTEVWYENPENLLNNLNNFIPNKKLSKIDNINSIARFAIYLGLIFSLLKLDNRWLLLPILILFLSYQLNRTTNFLDKPNPKIIQNIIKPVIQPIEFKTTTENPYMNYITNNRTIDNPISFPQLLPKNISINSDINTNLNTFVKNESILDNIPTNPLSQSISPSSPKIISKPSGIPNLQDSIPLMLSTYETLKPLITDTPIIPQLKSSKQSNVQGNIPLTLLPHETLKPFTTDLPISSNTDLINPYIDNSNYQTSNTINYDLCITSNNNKSCSPQNKLIDDPYNLSEKFKDLELKKEIRKNYRSHLKFDSINIWGTFINDRNYYTSPNIELVNDQSGFAEWCYTNNGESGKCKTDGNNCLKDRDIRYHKGRIGTNNS
jgi:hypothetical protein